MKIEVLKSIEVGSIGKEFEYGTRMGNNITIMRYGDKREIIVIDTTTGERLLISFD